MTATLPDQTLAWVNQIRAERSQPLLTALPKGVRCESLSCPVARAINAAVGVRLARHGRRTLHLPDYVVQFIEAFDRGEYPELIA